MITNSGAPVIPSHDSSEVEKDDRQNSYKRRKEINLNLKVINMLVVILSYFRSSTIQINPNQPQTDDDGIFNAIG